MKMRMKKLACVAVALAMIVPAAACKKKDSKKESSGVVSAAEEILDALTSLNMKKLKKIDAFSDCLEDLEVLAGCEPIKEMMKKASFEIDEDSVSEKKKKASCEATIKLPDYEAAVDEADGDPDAFIEAVEAQKEKKYKSVDVTLEFEVDDDEYTLSNGQELAAALYEDIFDNVLSSFGDPGTDPEPTDTDTTDPKPTDTDTTDPVTTTTSASEGTPIRDITVKKVELSEEAFAAAVGASDKYAADNMYDYGEPTVIGSYDAENYFMSNTADYSVMYMYYIFKNEEDAKAYFNDNVGFDYIKDTAVSYQDEGDWGYVAYQSYGYTYAFYYSGNGMICVFGLDSTSESVEKVEKFVTALCG